MTTPKWFALRNTFESVTRTNLKLMVALATDHHDKLLGESVHEPYIAQLYQDLCYNGKVLLKCPVLWYLF